ncbi:MAG: T9SS type A sorting domain-containing protein, partial [candidate division WOR-3 bacterium]|nr:T9SS type A sorting domain-containing protein [candidate division WOR-3 bacterium]
VRVYGCNRNGEVWEFTHIRPYVGIQEEASYDLLSSSEILNVYPNPFSRKLKIEYTLSDEGLSEISIYDVSGKLIRTLSRESQKPDYYEAFWDGRDEREKPVPCGVYFLKLKSGDKFLTKRVIFIK